VLVAGAGFYLALKQPESAPGDLGLQINPNPAASTLEIVASIKGRRDMWLAILAISWFWAVGSILITQIPILCGTVMHSTPAVNTFLVTMFALGVGLGALSAQGLLAGRVSAALAPVASAFLSLFIILFALSIWYLPAPPSGSAAPVSLSAFLQNWGYLRLGLGCLLVSVTGGVFVVPLNAYIQHRAAPHERSRVIAANNILNALFICLASLIVMLMTKAGLGLHHVFALVALTAVAVTGLTLYFLPAESLRTLAGLLLKAVYHPRVSGLEHLEELKGGPALLVANHTSFIDVVLLVVYIPRQLTFAVDSYWAQTWWLRLLLRGFKALPVNPNQPLATRRLIDALNEGDLVVIFPEGRITTTGSLMKIYEGPGLIAVKSRAPILPVVIDGPQYTRFGRLRQTLRHGPAKPVRMVVMKPRHLNFGPETGAKQKDQRHLAGEALLRLMQEGLFETSDYRRNMWTSFKITARQCGGGRLILEDAARQPASYRELRSRAKRLGRHLAALSRPGEKVGLLLPNSVDGVVALLALWAGGRVAVMLNYTQGAGSLNSALATAQVNTVVTSRAFLESSGQAELARSLPARLVCLEDFQPSPGNHIAAWAWRGRPAPADSPALILFTSGSEGLPKGVALSHQNLLANIRQMRTCLALNEDDIFFNALPMFHAFGLNTGVLTAIWNGMRCFNYVSPLHTKAVPELIYDTRATMCIASDTFASSWGRNAHPYDFSSLRIMLVGAEKLKPRTKALYAEKLGVRLFEGYGTTECAPVLTVNSHLAYRAGSVGRLLPGLEARIEPVEGVTTGGRLVVKGPNVMLGYIRPEQPGVIVPPADGWYDTGDIVDIDEDGFVWIKGRFKRFAKIGGEMVSLAAVEEVVIALWPGRPQAVIALEDETRGEKLVLVTDEPSPDLQRLWRAQKEAGQPELYFPRQFIFLPEIPLTPLGKINMPKLIEAARLAAAASA
jgi:acyl-[acyl-carrier-protein]-phospholipid O-acyltransferase/long-chain-fatty-acid--[acyl-carrier-protein] ligase